MMCPALVFTLILLSALAANGLQLSFRFKPLIGGPAFLPIHIIAQVSQYNAGSIAELDFVPQDPDASTLALLQGSSVPGLIRKKVLSENDKAGGDLSVICDSLLLSIQDNFDEQNLSLLNNNCYHFAYHTYNAVRAYNEKQE